MTKNLSQAEIEQNRLTIIENEKKQKFQTIKHIASLIQQNQNMGEEVHEFLDELENKSKIQPPTKESNASISFNRYVSSSKAAWYWITILLGAAAALTIFIIPEDALPLVYLRSAFGLFFILFLPGFVLMKTLFPDVVPIKISSERMDKLERVVLSMGISLILTPMVGLILNYTPWGVRLIPLTVSLLLFTVGLATVGIFRESKKQYGLSKT